MACLALGQEEEEEHHPLPAFCLPSPLQFPAFAPEGRTGGGGGTRPDLPLVLPRPTTPPLYTHCLHTRTPTTPPHMAGDDTTFTHFCSTLPPHPTTLPHTHPFSPALPCLPPPAPLPHTPTTTCLPACLGGRWDGHDGDMVVMEMMMVMVMLCLCVSVGDVMLIGGGDWQLLRHI